MKQTASSSERQHEAWYEEQGWHFDENNDFVDKNGISSVTHMPRVIASSFNIKSHVHGVLQEKYNLVQVCIPSIKGKSSTGGAKIFTSPDVGTNPVLLMLVQDLGQVPPGMWTRKPFIKGERNQWNYATQCPYIEWALQSNWAVVLCDVNHRGPYGQTAQGRFHHVRRVWEDVASPSQATCIMIVGLGAGTHAALSLMITKETEFTQRVMAIALLDGTSGAEYHQRRGGNWLKERCWSYVQGEDNEQVGNQNAETVPTRDHDKVPRTAFEGVMGYLEQWYQVYLAMKVQTSNK